MDLEVHAGEIVAVLGPNGAGKTTILEILEGQRHRDAGEVAVLGFDPERSPRRLRERIGIVPQETAVEPVLTVRETIELYAAAYPHPRPAGEVMALLDLEPQGDTRVRSLSGGQQRRLDLAVGIAGDPELVFLDEPTTGFDPSARRRSWDDPAAPVARQDGRSHDPLHGGGAAARGPRRRDRGGTGRGRLDPGPAVRRRHRR